MGPFFKRAVCTNCYGEFMRQLSDAVIKRQRLERCVARRLIQDALKAGYSISVNDGKR